MAAKKLTKIDGSVQVTGDLNVAGTINRGALQQATSQYQQQSISPTYGQIDTGYNNPSGSGGTTTPTTPSIVSATAYYDSVSLVASVQTNLRWLDHYEWQISEDETNWYSFRQDGVDWKGTLNATTSSPTQLITDQNLPFGGTADNPTGLTLYFRVRQVTKQSVNSSWSTPSSAVTTPIPGGKIAAAIIDAAKLNPKGMPSLANDVILYWSLDDLDATGDGSYSLTKDNSGNGHDGTASATLTSALGRAGDCVYFPDSRYIRNSAVGIGSSFSVSWWFKSNTPSSQFNMIATFPDSLPGGYFAYYMEPTNGIMIAIYYDGTYHEVTHGGPTLWDNNWHHIVGIATTTSVVLYIDGSQVSSGTWSINPSQSSADFQVGQYATGPAWIDEVRLYNRALSLAEIQYLYNHPTGDVPAMVTADRIIANSILAVAISAGAITTDKLAANSVTAGKISVTDLSAITASLGSITAGNITVTDAEGRTAYIGDNGPLLVHDSNGYIIHDTMNYAPPLSLGLGVMGHLTMLSYSSVESYSTPTLSTWTTATASNFSITNAKGFRLWITLSGLSATQQVQVQLRNHSAHNIQVVESKVGFVGTSTDFILDVSTDTSYQFDWWYSTSAANQPAILQIFQIGIWA